MKQNQNKQFWIGRNKQMEEKGSKTKHKEHINTETQKLHGNIKPGTVIYTQRTNNVK